MIKENRYIYILISLGLIFFLPFLGHVHLFDWDEINFAESAREMIATGDYLRVRVNFDPFWEKPPLFFWLQVLSMKVFGINEFAARFPNALFGILTLIVLFKIGKKHFSPKFGFIWALVYIGSFLPHLYSKSGIIDPIFNFFIFGAVYFLSLNLSKDTTSKKRLYAILGGTSIGLAIITKGPVGLLLLLLTFIVYLCFKRFRVKIRPLDIVFFMISAFFVTFAWFGYEIIQNGPWFLIEFIQYQIELFSEPVAGHEQPFFYHFVVVLLGCFPMSILAFGAFKKQQSTVNHDFLLWMKILFWVVLILFSIVTTKIVHYSSMTYLPLSFIATFYVMQLIENKKIIKKFISISLIVIGSIFSILLIITPILFYNKEFLKSLMNDPFAEASLNIDMGWTGLEFSCGLIFLIGLIIGFIQLKKQLVEQFIWTLTISISLTLLSYSIFVVPKIERFSQGPAIDFFKGISTKDAYLTTIGHKSYANYFYGKVKPSKETDGIATIKKNYINSLEHKEDFNVIELNTIVNNWLLSGDIDKDAYFVTKITKRDEMKTYANVEFMYNEGGFDFYKRTTNE